MKKILVLTALPLLLPVPALAQRVHPQPSSPRIVEVTPGDQIAAVVNDNVITTTDLSQRIRLAILSSCWPTIRMCARICCRKFCAA